MSVMEREPTRSRRSFTPDEFKRDAVALVIDRAARSSTWPAAWVSVRARWGTGCARPASIEVNEPGSPRRSGLSWPSCARRTLGCGWNEICSNERRPCG